MGIRQVATHAASQETGDAKSDTAATRCPGEGIVHSVETLEDALLVAVRNARPAIHESDLASFNLNVDLAVRVLDGVGDEVCADLPDGVRVGVDERPRALDRDARASVRHCRRGLNHGILRRERSEVERFKIVAPSSFLKAAEVEQLIDHAREAVGFHENRLDGALALGVVGKAIFRKEFGVEAYAGERGLELMRHVVDEVRLASGVAPFAAEPAHKERAAGQERADEQGEQTCSKSQKPDRPRPNSGAPVWPRDAQDAFAKGWREGTFASQSCRIGIV